MSDPVALQSFKSAVKEKRFNRALTSGITLLYRLEIKEALRGDVGIPFKRLFSEIFK
jgi:hypothetical protein